MSDARDVLSAGCDAQAAESEASPAGERASLLTMYRIALRSRRVDEAELRLRRQGRSFFHTSSMGHEVVQAAAAVVFRAGYDWFYPYYRDRCLSLGLGMTPAALLRQALAKDTDVQSRGREMPCHFGDPRLRIVNGSSATGSQFLHAVGTAEGIRLAREHGIVPGYGALADGSAIDDRRSGAAPERVESDEVVLVAAGEGATSEGEFYEAVSAASLGRLPVVFLIEDNGYAISVPVAHQTPGGNVSRLFRTYPHLLVEEIDGDCAVTSLRALERAAQYVRTGQGPAIVHAHLTRLQPHSDADDDKCYRSAAERAALVDPIERFTARLTERCGVSAEDLARIDREESAAVQSAVEQVLEEPDPEPSLERITEHLFARESISVETEPMVNDRELTLLESIRETLRIEMAGDERILVFGEDVADVSNVDLLGELAGKGGVFRVTQGLQSEFGAARVYNTPIAEAAIVGRALGLAVRGFLPVPEIQFFDYIWPAMHQIRNELSVLRWRSNDNFAAPMVLRVPIGGYLRGGALYHSQSAESVFCGCPGIRVVMPSNAADAAGLLRTSLRCGDPVLFLEHKHLYRQLYAKSPYPGADHVVPLGSARTARPGRDVTVVTYGALVEKSCAAARELAAAGVELEVIDLRSLQPYDWQAIAASVERTNRVVVAGEEPVAHGFAAEIAARIADELFAHLDAPVKRVGALGTPVPYAPILEDRMLPGAQDVVEAVRAALAF